MRVSVIIPTYNRAKDLPNTLRALRHQTHEDFEVIVVKGPCTDNTDEVLKEFEGQVRVYQHAELNINKQRNLGIRHATGEVCALIDDDSIPDQRWLADLIEGYDNPAVGGVGGLVYNHTGYTLQYRYAVCDRRANPRWDVAAPLTQYQLKGADPFVYLQGTNTSFRRTALQKTGGFDEEMEYYHDETELCMQMADHGLYLRPLDRAIVHHKFMPSHLRNEKKVLSRPFLVAKNKCYFTMRNGRDSGEIPEAMKDCEAFAESLKREARMHLSAGRLTDAEYQKFEKDLNEGVKTGIERGLTQSRKSTTFPPIDPKAFLKYPTIQPEGRRLSVCFVSQEFPPYSIGGIGRYVKDLAEGMARRGHRVYLVTKSPDDPRVDFENGVWVHRVPPQQKGDWWRSHQSPSQQRCLAWAAAAHAEVVRINEFAHLDIVPCPNWDSEGIFCLLDDRLTSLVTISTTLKTVREIDAYHRNAPDIESLLELEVAMVQCAPNIATPSANMLTKARRDFRGTPALEAGHVMHHGIPEAKVTVLPEKSASRIRILTVGRLEKRKGTDLMFTVASSLLPAYPNVEVVLVGNDRVPMDDGVVTYREYFEKKYRNEPWFNRVIFKGMVSEESLPGEYAACDIFCLPARFESFGLVLVEAMMHSKPVVACAVGGMPEIIVDGVTGFLAYPNSATSILHALRTLIDNESLRREMGRAARERYAAKFSVDVMVQTAIDVYSTLTRRPAVAA
jgi:glycogen synthase